MKQKLQPQKAGVSGPNPTLFVSCYILEPLGKEGGGGMREAFTAKSEVCVPHKPRVFVLSYLHVIETHRQLLMEHVRNNCKSRG